MAICMVSCSAPRCGLPVTCCSNMVHFRRLPGPMQQIKTSDHVVWKRCALIFSFVDSGSKHIFLGPTMYENACRCNVARAVWCSERVKSHFWMLLATTTDSGVHQPVHVSAFPCTAYRQLWNSSLYFGTVLPADQAVKRLSVTILEIPCRLLW